MREGRKKTEQWHESEYEVVLERGRQDSKEKEINHRWPQAFSLKNILIKICSEKKWRVKKSYEKGEERYPVTKALNACYA